MTKENPTDPLKITKDEQERINALNNASEIPDAVFLEDDEFDLNNDESLDDNVDDEPLDSNEDEDTNEPANLPSPNLVHNSFAENVNQLTTQHNQKAIQQNDDTIKALAESNATENLTEQVNDIDESNCLLAIANATNYDPNAQSVLTESLNEKSQQFGLFKSNPKIPFDTIINHQSNLKLSTLEQELQFERPLEWAAYRNFKNQEQPNSQFILNLEQLNGLTTVTYQIQNRNQPELQLHGLNYQQVNAFYHLVNSIQN